MYSVLQAWFVLLINMSFHNTHPNNPLRPEAQAGPGMTDTAWLTCGKQNGSLHEIFTLHSALRPVGSSKIIKNCRDEVSRILLSWVVYRLLIR